MPWMREHALVLLESVLNAPADPALNARLVFLPELDVMHDPLEAKRDLLRRVKVTAKICYNAARFDVCCII